MHKTYALSAFKTILRSEAALCTHIDFIYPLQTLFNIFVGVHFRNRGNPNPSLAAYQPYKVNGILYQCIKTFHTTIIKL